MTVIDISVPLFPGCVAWPGDGDFRQETLCRMEDGAPCTTSALWTTAHMGTHLDAPRHFIAGGPDVESLDPARLIGPCRVVEVDAPGHVTADALASAVGDDWPRRLLLKTRNSAPGGAIGQDTFDKAFAAVAPDAAELVVERGVDVIGIDYYSVAAFDDGVPTHRTLLGAGLIPLEGLDLRNVQPGEYELIALPLKLRGLDGSPVRAVLISE